MKRFILTLAFVLVAIAGISQLTQTKAGADPGDTTATASAINNATYSWVDAAHITATLGDGQTVSFADTPGVNAGGSSNFLSESVSNFYGGNCNAGGTTGQSTLTANNWNGSNNGSGSVNWLYLQPAHGVCSQTQSDIKIGSTGNSNILFHWNSTNNDVEDVSDGNNKYTRDSATAPGDNVYQLGGVGCGGGSSGGLGGLGTPAEYIVIAPDDSATLWILTSDSAAIGAQKVTDASTDAIDCYAVPLGNPGPLHRNANGSYDVHVSGVKYISVAASGTVTCAGGDTAKSIAQCPGTTQTSSTGTSFNCPSSALSWLICPIASAMNGAINFLNTEVHAYLDFNVEAYFSDNCVNGASSTSSSGSCSSSNVNYAIWGSIRDIALSLLVVVALIMVISTAIDIGPFDAYTVKKILPRILIAVILISFSWELARFLVQFSDDLGDGVTNLFASVMPGTVNVATITSNAIGWFAGAAGAGAVLLVAVGPLALIMLLLPALIAFGMALLVLIVRQLIIVVCVITVPIAFISFVLPGTQGIWKFWQKTFFGALFLFPMVTALIATGALMAYIISPSYGGDASAVNYGDTNTLIALIFLIAPYFLIPRVFRMSSGMLGTIAGGINNAGQGLIKASKQAQRNKMASSFAKAKKGDLYHGYGWLPGSQKLASGVSGVTRAAGTGWGGHFGIGERGKQAIHKNDNSAIEEYMRSPENAAFKDFDAAQAAKTYANATEAEAGLEKDWGITDADERKTAIEAARVSGGFGGYQSIAAARNLAMSTTAYKDDIDPETGEVTTSSMEKANETIARVSRGNMGIASGLAAFTSSAAKQQRPDMSPGAEAFIGLARDRITKGSALSKETYKENLDKAFGGAGSIQQMLAYAKKPTVESFMRRQLEVVSDPEKSSQQRAKAAIHIQEMYKNLSSAGGDQRDAVIEALGKAKIDIRGEGVSVGSQLVARATTGTNQATLNGAVLTEGALASAARSWGDAEQAAQGMQGNVGPPDAGAGENNDEGA